MSNLLQIVRSFPKALQKKGALPIILEFSVSPETAPYLVSSLTSLLWIEEPHPGNIVKAAVREITAPDEIFFDVLKAVVSRGVEYQWGNVHPFTKAGLEAAIEHVESYDLPNVEILAGAKPHPEWLSSKVLQIPVRLSSWVPKDCAVIVPTNREFVGFLVHLKPKTIALAIHNASRAIGIAWNQPE